ncbi:MAG: XRE family transcriptional regulator [Candidatus Faecousia sp.]|nr:XRE family transcriptional regulator [Candidatus Faecousia sp.]
MRRKSTKELNRELSAAPDWNRFLENNREQFQETGFLDYLLKLFQDAGISKVTLAKRAETSEIYLYQIFSGARMPSRDRVLCLCFGLSATLAQTQELLRIGGMAQLYPKNKRDAIIIYGLTHGQTLPQVNELLFAESKETLG